MAVNYPTSIDSFVQPSASNPTNSPSHSGQHQDENSAIIALETKVGSGSSTPSSGKIMHGTGSGSSAWDIDLDTDGTLAADSDTKIPSQKAVKTYADTKALPSQIPVKASGAEINTGTDDNKFVTAKAIADSYINLSAYVEITSPFTGATNTNVQDVTNLNVSITVPTGGRRLKITLWAPYCQSTSASGTDLNLYLREGSTTLSTANCQITSGYNAYLSVIYSAVISAGSHTYKASVSNSGAGRPYVYANAVSPAFILVETV